MNKKHTTIKIWVSTRKKLRLLAALTDKSMVVILDELVSRALWEAQEREDS